VRSAAAHQEEDDGGTMRLGLGRDPEPLVDETAASKPKPASAPNAVPAADPGADERIKELEDALEKAREAEAQLAREFKNYRRHAEADLARTASKARVQLLAELADTVQALELACSAADKDPASVREGIVLCARNLKKVFDRHGLVRIAAQGVPFDPTLHEAVLAESIEGARKGTVVREVSPGFRTEDEVIRPAKVSVAA
jgi:molecular chaperone GrpE